MNGGLVMLSNVVAVLDGNVSARADGTNSLVDLIGVGELRGPTTPSQWRRVARAIFR